MRSFLVSIFLLMLFSGPLFGAATSDQYLEAGKKMLGQGDTAMAAKYFSAAAKVDPQNWKAYQYLGYCQYKLGDRAAALSAYQSSDSLHPDPGTEAFIEKLKTNSNGPGMDASGQALLNDFYAAKQKEDQAREGLKLYGQNHPLSADELYAANWGAKPSDFKSPSFEIEMGVLYSDVGFYLDPMTNVGLDWLYIPISEQYYNGETYVNGYYQEAYQTENSSFLFLEPHIKFYSSPGGLSSYHGFGFVFAIYTNSLETYDDFSVFGLSYMFGFRTLPADGWTMELGFQVMLCVYMGQQTVYTGETYSNGYYQDTYSNQSLTIPFPMVLPQWQFGYHF